MAVPVPEENESQKPVTGAGTATGTVKASALLAFFACAVLLANLLTSFAIAHGASEQWRLAFRFLCHGIASRCLVVFGVPMPICARCAAIYAGLIIGVVIVQLLPSMRERGARIVLAVAITPMGIDGMTQLVRLRESTNDLRVATGVMAGIALAMWCVAALRSS